MRGKKLDYLALNIFLTGLKWKHLCGFRHFRRHSFHDTKIIEILVAFILIFQYTVFLMRRTEAYFYTKSFK